MTDISKTARPDLILVGGDELDRPVGPLAAYLRALEARIGALERRSSAVPSMTAADAARYARVNVETILRAVRGGELPVAGYVGRSPRISRDAVVGWLATRSPSAPPVARQPRRGRGRKASDVVEAVWQRLGESPDTSHRDAIVDAYSRVIDEPDAPRLATQPWTRSRRRAAARLRSVRV